MCVLSCFSCVRLSVTLRTVACQALQSMGFSRQEYWSGLPCLPPGDFPDPRIKPQPPVSLALADSFFTTSATWETQINSSWWLSEGWPVMKEDWEDFMSQVLCAKKSQSASYVWLSLNHETNDILSQIITCCRGCPVYYRMLNTIPGFNPLDASGIPPHLWQPKISPDIVRCVLWSKIIPS